MKKYRIKEMIWGEEKNSGPFTYFNSGQYYVQCFNNSKPLQYFALINIDSEDVIGAFDTLEEAKEACEEYRFNILMKDLEEVE